MITPAVVKSIRAVLPKEAILIPVGGISADNIAAYQAAGANAFGIGSTAQASASMTCAPALGGWSMPCRRRDQPMGCEAGRSTEHLAAVDGQGLAGDPGCSARAKEKRGIGDLLGMAEAPPRDRPEN
mgnify:CR=1 FL=1